MERTSGRLIATGRGVHVAYDYAAGRSTLVWPELRAGLEALAGHTLGPDEA